MDKNMFYSYFLNVPVAVNNLYGDPFLPYQKENTFQKLQALCGNEEKNQVHKGPVAVITKSELSNEDVLRLKNFRKNGLNLAILVSISSLPKNIENVPGNRYKTLERCVDNELPCLAYVRPFIPGENTGKETVISMFQDIYNTGTTTVVISGLRGSDRILIQSGIKPENITSWSRRVKIVPKDVREAVKEALSLYKIQLYERTSCGVAHILWLDKSYNPYYASPQLAGCMNCPERNSCFDKQNYFIPTADDIELVKYLGYHASRVNSGCFELCKTNPQKRTECVSCCTSCFMLQRDAICVEPFDGICLGDISLLRLLTGKLVFCNNLIDSGDPTIARPKQSLLSNENIYLLNSWWSYSRNIYSCYGCSYCIVPEFKNENIEYGDTPYNVATRLYNKIFDADRRSI